MAEKRSSLLDDAGLSSAGAPKAIKKSGGGQGVKLALALALFVVAFGIFAYSRGWILATKEPAPPPPTAEEMQQYKQQQQQMQKLQQEGKVTAGGA